MQTSNGLLVKLALKLQIELMCQYSCCRISSSISITGAATRLLKRRMQETQHVLLLLFPGGGACFIDGCKHGGCLVSSGSSSAEVSEIPVGC